MESNFCSHLFPQVLSIFILLCAMICAFFFQDRPWNCNKMPYLLQRTFVVSDARISFLCLFLMKSSQLITSSYNSQNMSSEFQQDKPDFENLNSFETRWKTVSSWFKSLNTLGFCLNMQHFTLWKREWVAVLPSLKITQQSGQTQRSTLS